MKHKKLLTVWAVTIAALFFASSAMADTDKEAAAVEAAKAWLALIDNGNYGDSWEAAAAYFKGAITKEYWQQTLTAFREPLGALISRKVRSKTYTRSLPDAGIRRHLAGFGLFH